MHVNQKDVGAGALFLGFGLFFALSSFFGLTLGNPHQMGPGFFPFLLGAVLCCFGLGILLNALRIASQSIGAIPWRGLILVFASVLFFTLTVTGLGILPALAGCTFLAGMAPRDANWKSVAVLTIALTAFCMAIFIYGLRLPYPVFGPWLVGR